MTKKSVRGKKPRLNGGSGKVAVPGAPICTVVVPFPKEAMKELERIREEAKKPIPRRVANIIVGPIQGITQGYTRPRKKK